MNECCTNWLQKMLLQEVMHQAGGVNRLILRAIWHTRKLKKQQNELF
jgi:hypothetical protein